MNKKRLWKTSFLILLTINGLIIMGIALLLFISPDQDPIPETKDQHISASEFLIQTNKQDLNKLINHYIEKEGLNGPVHYNVLLTNEVELFGEVKVFSESMQLKMTFEPRALENGDLVLEQKTLSIGGLPVPVSYILTFIRDYYKLPDWVTIHPNDKQIYVALQKMRLNGDIQFRVEEFNLEDDQISMRMLVPVE